MKTIHDSIHEMLELIEMLKNSGLDIAIMYMPQEILDVPHELTESLTKAYLPRILEFYQNKDNMREYMAWKLEQNKATEQII